MKDFTDWDVLEKFLYIADKDFYLSRKLPYFRRVQSYHPLIGSALDFGRDQEWIFFLECISNGFQVPFKDIPLRMGSTTKTELGVLLYRLETGK